MVECAGREKNKNFLSLDWTCIYWGSRRFCVFENGRKSEARFWGVVTLHCQTTEVNGQRTTVNGQRSTDNGQRTMVNRQWSTDLTTNYSILIKQYSNY